LGGDIEVLRFKDLRFRGSEVQGFRGSGVQRFRGSGVQRFRGSMFRGSGLGDSRFRGLGP